LLAVLSGYPRALVLPTVLQAARSSAAPVRIAAMKALESTGDPSIVPFLAEKAADARGPERAAARSALGMLKGRAVDEAILALLAQKPTDAVAGEMLLAIADRRIFAAKPVVAASLTSPSADVRAQALRTLRAIGTPSDTSAVLGLLLKSADESERGEAEKTAAALAQKVANSAGRSREVKARLATEKAPDARVRLFNVLPLIGDNSALPILRAALQDSNAEIRDAAVRALAAWPTSAARDDMVGLARDSANETHRLLATVSLVRSVGLDPYRNPEAAVADLKLAAGFASRPEEQKLILGAVVAFPCKGALDLAAGYLQEPAVKAEAQAAVDNITTRLKKGKDALR
jgi:HEAT repeat protein